MCRIESSRSNLLSCWRFKRLSTFTPARQRILWPAQLGREKGREGKFCYGRIWTQTCLTPKHTPLIPLCFCFSFRIFYVQGGCSNQTVSWGSDHALSGQDKLPAAPCNMLLFSGIQERKGFLWKIDTTLCCVSVLHVGLVLQPFLT